MLRLIRFWFCFICTFYRAFLFVIDYGKNEIVTEDCTQQPNPNIPTQITRLSLNEEIAGRAAVLGEILFVKDAQRLLAFCKTKVNC